MTRQYFEAFAEYIRNAEVDPKTADAMRTMVVSIAKRFNGRFDTTRFNICQHKVKGGGA